MPQNPAKNQTVVHSRVNSKNSQSNVKPVFDCLFCADSYIYCMLLSMKSLTIKYAYPYIEMRANELAYR